MSEILTNGVRFPALAHRFKLTILPHNVEDEKIDNLIRDVLSAQVVKIGDRDIFENRFGFASSNMDITFEVDIKHHVIKALEYLYEHSRRQFDLKVEYFTGNHTVMRTSVYKNCSIFSVKESALDYKAKTSEKEVNISAKNPVLSIDEVVDAINKNSDMHTLVGLIGLISRSNFSASIPAKENKSIIVAKTNISFDSCENTFAD